MSDPVPVVAQVDLGTATLLPDIDRDGAYLLALDGVPQSYVDLNDPTYLEFEYVQRFAHLTEVLGPTALLHLGGGAMSLPRYVAAVSAARQRVVEIDAALVALVRKHLPFDPRIQVSIGSAREILEQQADGSFDLIVADIFAGSQIPASVTSVEFFAHAARVVGTGGVYAANIADQAPFPFARAVAAGAAAVFDDCRLLAEPGVFRGRRFGNLMLIGTSASHDFSELSRRIAGDPFPARLQSAEEFREFVGDTAAMCDAAPVASPTPPPGMLTLP